MNSLILKEALLRPDPDILSSHYGADLTRHLFCDRIREENEIDYGYQCHNRMLSWARREKNACSIRHRKPVFRALLEEELVYLERRSHARFRNIARYRGDSVKLAMELMNCVLSQVYV